MAIKHIVQHTSFFTLNTSQKAVVRDFVEAPSPHSLPNIDIYDVFKHHKALSLSVDYWKNKIKHINPVLLQLMSDDDKAILRDQLFFVSRIFSESCVFAYKQGNGSALNDYGSSIEKCFDLINLLKNPNQDLVYPQILNTIHPITDDGIYTTLEWMGAFNECRLYWVWAGGGGLIGNFINLLPDTYLQKKQASDILDIPGQLGGILSWALYYFRFSIRIAILLRHTIPGFWMSVEEQQIPWLERLYNQWQQLKFDLLNDFFWADANLVCFFWLTGSTMADYYGGLLTAVLLLMDVCNALWNYSEEYGQYKIDMQQYQSDIAELTSIGGMDKHIALLQQAMCQSKLDWDYKLYALYVNVIYAISLLFAFSLVYSFFILPSALSAVVALTCGLSGTILCFSLNAICAASQQGLTICKSIEQWHDLKNELGNKLQQDLSFASIDEQKRLYLEAKQLEMELDYQLNEIHYQHIILLRSVLIDILVPPIIFISLIYMPLGLGLTLMAASFVLAVWSHDYVNKNYKPADAQLPDFDENEFSEFNVAHAQQNLDVLTQTDHGFFGSVERCLRQQRNDVRLIEHTVAGF